jgi:hypothetical protein
MRRLMSIIDFATDRASARAGEAMFALFTFTAKTTTKTV